jgi:hypothetical protein
MSWPEALELLSAELGETVTFRVATERQFLERLTGAGIPAGEAELLITREWAILAGENNYSTGTFQQITGRPSRPVAEFLHNHRGLFLQCPRAILSPSGSAASAAAPEGGPAHDRALAHAFAGPTRGPDQGPDQGLHWRCGRHGRRRWGYHLRKETPR